MGATQACVGGWRVLRHTAKKLGSSLVFLFGGGEIRKWLARNEVSRWKSFMACYHSAQHPQYLHPRPKCRRRPEDREGKVCKLLGKAPLALRVFLRVVWLRQKKTLFLQTVIWWLLCASSVAGLGILALSATHFQDPENQTLWLPIKAGSCQCPVAPWWPTL